jgi:hypothetical protein
VSWAIRVFPEQQLLVTSFHDDISPDELKAYVSAVKELAADFPPGFREVVDGRRVVADPTLSGAGIFSAVGDEDEHTGSRRIAIVVAHDLNYAQARQYNSARTGRFSGDAAFFERTDEAAAWHDLPELADQIEQFLLAAPAGATRAG